MPLDSTLDLPNDATSGSRRFAPVLEDLLAGAVTRSEIAIAWVRGSLALLGFLNLMVFSAGNAHPSQSVTVRAVALVAAMLFSLWVMVVLGRRQVGPLELRASALSDAVLVTVLVGAQVMWPSLDYPGVLRVPHWALFVLATTASGLRLSRPVALLAVVANGLGLVGVLSLDLVRNDVGAPSPYELALLAVVFLGSAFIAAAVARQTRRLVYDGAFAVVEAERARQHLGVYVSEEVAAEALKADDLELGGRRQEVAVLFCDLRGFTGYAERLEPERLVTELNAYLDAMVEAIRAEGGVVDKYIGDAIMAVFGVPRAHGDEAARAVRAAAAMRLALQGHNRVRQARGLGELRQGVGVHFGPVVAGNVGTQDRQQYTVLGDTVNLASRLESATKELGVDILLSDAAVDAARIGGEGALPILEEAGSIKVRGREAALAVYTIRT